MADSAKVEQAFSGEEKSLLISKDNLTISAEEAQNVAILFAEVKFLTKGINERKIKEVVTVHDSINRPLLYINNMENESGFIIVSATKEFYPILAYSDEGSFCLLGDTIIPWLGVMEKEITYRMDQADTTYNNSWKTQRILFLAKNE